MKSLIAICLFFVTSVFGQNYVERFPFHENDKEYAYSGLIQPKENTLIYVYSVGTNLYSVNSFDNGETWNTPNQLLTSVYPADYGKDNFSLALAPDSSVLLLTNSSILKLFRTVDYGETWEDKRWISRSNDSTYKQISSSISVLNDSLIWITYSCIPDNSNVEKVVTRYHEITDNAELDIPRSKTDIFNLIEGEMLNITQINDSTLFGIRSRKINTEEENNNLYGIYSYDNGATWTDEFLIVSNTRAKLSSELIKNNNSYILLYSETEHRFSLGDYDFGGKSSSVLYVESNDNCETWSEPRALTEYVGNNGWHETNVVNGELYTVFHSDRFREDGIYVCQTINSLDTLTPPIFSFLTGSTTKLTVQEVIIECSVLDNQVSQHYVKLFYGTKESNLDTIDIPHISDNNYSISLGYFNDGDTVYYKIQATDDESYTIESDIEKIAVVWDGLGDRPIKALVNINNFALPINNTGVLGDVRVKDVNDEYLGGSYFEYGRYDEKEILFSGGFTLSGYNNTSLWGNGSATTHYLTDYNPGVVSSGINEENFMIYKVSGEDSAFGSSWLMWKNAVVLGANFYDGDGDGEYNPEDKNNDGVWNENEDKPDLLGDVTYWTVFNDGVSPIERRYVDQEPMGIEIRQTIWGYSSEIGLNNTLFIRYSILNTGEVNDVFDKVIFSLWADADLGTYYDDLAGVDTLLNSCYTYNDSADYQLGDSPPALFIQLLQGPPVVQNNDIYINNKGKIGVDSLAGFRNSNLGSFTAHLKNWNYSDPQDVNMLRYYSQGRDKNGDFADPCNFEIYGDVFSMDCNMVIPQFMFSGDPVNQYGWLQTKPLDVRMFNNTEEFTLEVGKPVDIIAAYIVGDGESALHSVEVGKKYARDIRSFYESNFTDYVVDIDDNNKPQIPSTFALSQNYPNPFNPTTTIEYSIPRDVKRETGNVKGTFIPSGVEVERVQLIVYDILGREVATLVNENQKPGNYKISFPRHSGEGRNLASGIYFYKLTYRSNIVTKKMVLLK